MDAVANSNRAVYNFFRNIGQLVKPSYTSAITSLVEAEQYNADVCV